MAALARRLQLIHAEPGDRWMQTALKVAFATSDMKHVDQHFGATKSFAIYALNEERAGLAEAMEFGPAEATGHDPDRLAARIDALEGCIAVYCLAVGASAIQQLKSRGVQPVKISAETPIGELLETLQQELRDGPGGWLARALNTGKADASRFDQMEAEGWEE